MPTPPFPYPFPQPTAGALTFSDSLGDEVSADIYTKQRWSNSWTHQTQLDLLQVTWNAAPNVPIATLRYRYGRVLEKTATAETTRTKVNLLGYYVKIVVHGEDGDLIWHGFVDDVSDEQHGTVNRIVINPDPDPPTTLYEAAGVQTLSCVGMIAALDRSPLQRTYFQCTGAFANNGTDLYRVAWSPPLYNMSPDGRKSMTDKFGQQKMPPTRASSQTTAPNFGAGPTRQAYRHWFPGLYGQPNTNTADRWTLGDALENLAAYNAPRVGVYDDTGTADTGVSAFVPVFIFDHDVLDPENETVTQYADWFEPQLDCDGLTLKGALDKLLNPLAGQGYWVWVDETETPHRVYVEPFSSITTAVNMTNEAGETKVFPANTRVVAVQTSTDSATAVTSQTSGATNYTSVLVTGAPMITVASVTIANQFANGWASTLQDAYDAEIASLNSAVLRDLQRMRDLREQGRYRSIGRNFVLKHTWDFKLGSTPRDVFLGPAEANSETFPAGRYLPFGMRMRLLDYLPFREGIDYAAADTAALKTTHLQSRAPYRKAEIYARSFATDATLTGKFTCWSTKAERDVLYDPNDPAYSLKIDELVNEMAVGLQVDVVNGYQGALASGGGRVAPHVPKLDPAQLTFTVAMQSDLKVFARKRNPVSVSGTTPTIDADRVKLVDMGERLQYIEVLKDSVVSVNESGDTLRKVPEDFVLRDDTAQAKQIADFLATYYFQPRSIVRIKSRRVTAKLWPGQIIATLNAGTNHAVTANALITEVSVQMGVGVNGTYAKPTYTVQTAFGEIDPLQFFPRLTSGG
jgi:hypothetical protein